MGLFSIGRLVVTKFTIQHHASLDAPLPSECHMGSEKERVTRIMKSWSVGHGIRAHERV